MTETISFNPSEMKWHSKEVKWRPACHGEHGDWASRRWGWEHRFNKSLDDWPALTDIPVWADCTTSGNALLTVFHLPPYPWVSKPPLLIFHLHSFFGFSTLSLACQGAFSEHLRHPVSLSLLKYSTEPNPIFWQLFLLLWIFTFRRHC